MPMFQVCRTITYDYTYEVEAKDEDEAIDFACDDVEGKYSSAVSLTHCEQIDSEFYDVDRIINHTEVRNTIIRAMWEGLKYTELSYKKRRTIISTKL